MRGSPSEASQRLIPGGARPGCYRWWVVSLTLTTVLVLIVQRMSLSVAIVPWSEECGWSTVETQAQLGAFSWGYLVTMLPGSLLASRYSANAELLAAILVASSLVSAATPYAGCDHTRGALLRVALGLAQGPLFPTVAGVIGAWVLPTEYSRANAFVSEGSNMVSELLSPAHGVPFTERQRDGPAHREFWSRTR